MDHLKIVNGHCSIPMWKTTVSNSDFDFKKKKQITSVEIPDGVEKIDIEAFANTSITQIHIPASVSEIESGAFSRCDSLEKITVAEGNSSYCSKNNCCLSKDGTELIFGCKTTVEIPEGVEEICDEAFSGTSITEIHIPASVSEIESGSFSGCDSLEKITVAEGNRSYCSKNNCCLSKDGTKLIFGCKTSIIPNSVKVIEGCAFSEIMSLKAIHIPNGVKKIECCAFSGSGLTGVEIPKSVEKIDETAFSYCDDLVSFVVDPKNKHYISKENKCFERDSLELVFEPDPIENLQTNKNETDEKSEQLDNVMKLEILDPEEERDFLLNNLKYLFDYSFSQSYKLVSYDVDYKTFLRIMLKEGRVEFWSQGWFEEDYHDAYEIKFKTVDGGFFRYIAKDDYYIGFSYALPEDMFNSIFRPDTIIYIDDCACRLSMPLPRMDDIVRFLINDGKISDEEVDDLYDAVAIELRTKVLEKKKKKKDEHIKEEQRKKLQEELSDEIKKTENGCYIATCVYGSYDCPEVWTLRRFRDYTLTWTWYGRLFIKTYYAISPTLVNWFGSFKWFKRMWHSSLDKFVAKLISKGVMNTPYQDLF